MIRGSPRSAEASNTGRKWQGQILSSSWMDELEYIHDHPAVQEAWIRYCAEDEVRGDRHLPGQREENTDCPLASRHQGCTGSAIDRGRHRFLQSDDPFCPTRKKQNFNAPVGKDAAFAYTTALNHLLRVEAGRRFRIGDATTVFWTERASPIEGFMGMILDPRDDAGDLARCTAFPGGGSRRQTCPRNSMILTSIFIFWDCLLTLPGFPSVSGMSAPSAISAEKIGQHFRDLAIVRSVERDPEFPGMWQSCWKQLARVKETNR